MTEIDTRPSPRSDADEAYRQFAELDDATFRTAFEQRHGMTEAEQRGIMRAALERNVSDAPAIPESLPDVLTGELLPATTENAARAIEAAREMKRRCDDVVHAATAYAAEESRRLGIKTIPLDRGSLILSGGPSTEIDPETLREALVEADCPEERIDAAIKTEITYKVDRAVVRQLAAANEDYRAAVELATRPIVKPLSASVKRR